MRFKFLIFTIFLFLTHNQLKGQSVKSFTEDSVVFITEIRTAFNLINIKENKEKALETLNRFSELWFANQFDHRQKTAIYSISNLMLKNKLKVYPSMEQLLQTLSYFKTNNHPTASFNNWLASMRVMLENSRNTRNFSTYLEFSAGLFKGKNLYFSKIFSWKINTNDFQFNNDSAFSLSIPELSLKCITKYDSSTIINTSGTFFPLTNAWNGRGGKITWWRTGLSTDSVFAFLGNYNISLKSSQYEVDSVIFYNKKFFTGTLIGKLTEKVSFNSFDPHQVSYPKFESYTKKLFIAEIFRDIDYDGGFSMKGQKMVGESGLENQAQIIFKRPYKDKTGKYDVLVARSDAFIIEKDRINAAKATVSIFHQDDSIFHSGLRFKYMNKNREIAMLRIEEGNMKSPYFDSFHGLYIDCEAVYWRMDDSFVSLKSIEGIQKQSTAIFISDNFYFEEHFDKLMGLNTKHPLLQINEYSKKYQTSEFYIYELARFMNYPETQIEALVINLAQQGFLIYNLEKKKAYIEKKLTLYIDAKNKKTDYDVIAFISNVENKNNATLSLDNFDFAIGGVPDVSLSDSQNVYIQPTTEEVVLRKNKDFLFSGKVDAGLFNFMAKDCSFEYDTFRLNLPTIEYMKFKVKSFEPQADGKRSLVEVKTVVSDISGDLLIDHPTNKSGLKQYPRYPEFNSKTESFVYYDVNPTLKQAYNRERFKYFLRPFKIENLENFSTDSLQFFGVLNSGGIFPEIEHPLQIQKDYSLGFITKTPANGYPIYGNKGTFTSEISLSNNGLRGNGTLNYLNSTSQSKDFIFYLDSTQSKVENFQLKKMLQPPVEYPSVHGQNLRQHWLPYQDSMYLTTTDSLMKLYDDQAKLKGTVLLTPNGLTGDGFMNFYDASLHAKNILFSANSFQSDTTILKINALDAVGIAFMTNIYKANIDFTSKTGHFETNGKGSTIEFPINQFNCYMDEFDWQMNENKIELRNLIDKTLPDFDKISLSETIDLDLTGSDFVSTNTRQDSLEFFSLNASYDLNTSLLQAKDVRIIKIADAAIFPKDGLVEIEKNAVIRPLTNATIIADTLNRKHQIDSAEVKIISRTSFKAHGNYSFTNAVDEIQNIVFEDIKVDTTGTTIAQGNILPEQNFMLSPQLAFKGKITLTASEPFLDFDGAFMINQDCATGLSRWVKFEHPVDPKNILLPIAAQPEEYGVKKLYAGFFHSAEENRVYPAFLSRKSYYSDTLMISVEGWLSPKKHGRELLIGSLEDVKLPENSVLSNPFMSINTDECKITVAGPITFGTDLGQVSLSSYGKIEHYIIPDSTVFNIFLSVDFFFANNALLFMKDKLSEVNANGLDMASPVFTQGLTNMLGNEEAGKVLSEMSLFGSVKRIPDLLMKSIIFSDVKFVYNKTSRSFVSQGPIGVATILGNSVNKIFEGYIEIVRRRSGDIINIYLEADRRNWYYFRYSNKMMEAISSYEDFNKMLTEVKTEKRKDKEDKLEEGYRFQPSNAQRKNSFLRNMKSEEPNEEEK